MNVLTIAMAGLSLLVAGCSGGGEQKKSDASQAKVEVAGEVPGDVHHEQKATKKVTPGEAVRNYIKSGGSHFSLDDKEMKIEERPQPGGKCAPADECGTVLVTAAGYVFPFVYARVDNRWFIDGIPLTQDWKPEFRKPPLSTVKRQEEQVALEGEPKPELLPDRTRKFDPDEFINVSPAPGKPSVVVFCDVGLAYCLNTVNALASMENVNTVYWPVAINDWSVEANAIVLSSPRKMRAKVFSLLSGATGIPKEELRAHVKRQTKIDIQDALFNMNRDAVIKKKDEAIKAGVRKLPTVVLPDSSTIVGNLSADELATRVKESIQRMKAKREETASADRKDSGNKPVEKESGK